ncbi:hypothetical protein CspeluHIS016_0101210 [Cutaneotrichosporon spelunceum]|uniref:Uncharacterized protein n=1 Tax=Cutaneotrichosporon spelunceum TaxID=1672016 RepID=A0AAD3TMS4_9TREE|nr:hypothetical protein CspeluHIS016_0101210 [Cutaneotrichosporon spelunceum]
MSPTQHTSLSNTPTSTRTPSRANSYRGPTRNVLDLVADRSPNPFPVYFQPLTATLLDPQPTFSPPAKFYLENNQVTTTKSAAAAADALCKAQGQASKTLASAPVHAAESLATCSGWAHAQGVAAANATFNSALSAQAVKGYSCLAAEARATCAAYKSWNREVTADLENVERCAEDLARCEMDAWVASTQVSARFYKVGDS